MSAPGPPGQPGQNERRQEAILEIIINRMDSQIRIEFELVNQRMSWLMVAQSFLFIAYATVWVGLSREVNIILSKLTLIIPSIGIAMAILVRIAIWAAHNIVSHVKDERARFEKEHPAYKDYRISVHRKELEHKLGNFPAQILPFLFIASWAALLYWTINPSQ